MYKIARERVCNPLATMSPFTSKPNHPKAARIAPCVSDSTKKTMNTTGTSHILFEGLDLSSISPSPGVVVWASFKPHSLSGVEHLRARSYSHVSNKVSMNLGYGFPRRHLSGNSVNRAPSRLVLVCASQDVCGLELAPIGWQLFVLDHCANEQAASSSSIATFATRLLARPLSLFLFHIESCRLYTRRAIDLLIAAFLANFQRLKHQVATRSSISC
jgi:hypothetical protein